MKKLLLTIFAVGTFAMSTNAQSVMITSSLTKTPSSSALVQYNNLFGQWNMPDKDDPFPFAVIRVDLTGNANSVRAAKLKLGFDVGSLQRIESDVRTEPNKIIILVPREVRNISLTCGDGCEKQVLYSGRLESNAVYTCKVEYTPAENEGQKANQVATDKKSNIVVMNIVDKTQQIPEAFQQIILSNFSKRILETSSYEMNDVSRVSNMINENEYKATGNLSPDQLSAINKSGVDYLLLTEINFANAKKQIDNKNLEKFVDFFNADDYIVNVKVLNTKTNVMEKSDYFISKNNRTPMQNKSLELAGRLFQQQTQDVVSEEEPIEEPIEEVQEAEALKIVRYSKSDRKLYDIPEYKYGETAMDREAMAAFLKRNCPDAYKKMAKSKGVIAGGWSCFAVGLAALAGGMTMEMLYINNRFNDWEDHSDEGYYSKEYNDKIYVYTIADKTYRVDYPSGYKAGSESIGGYPFKNKYTTFHTAGVAMVCAGAALSTVVSIPLLTAGYGMRNNAYKKFNKKCATSTPLTLNLQASGNGLGLALNF